VDQKTDSVKPVRLGGLPFALESVGAPPIEYSLDGEALKLTAAAATDLFVDPAAGGDAPPDAGRLEALPPAGDFTLAARVRPQFASIYDAGALLLFAGDRRWAKLAFELSPQRRPTAVTVVTRGLSDDANCFEPSVEALWLRVTRKGLAWAFHASEDGEWWRLLRYFSLGEHEAGQSVRVGFLAQSPTGPGCTAVFDHIAFATETPGDLRDGS
jgi:regulation of enolase protein 1 (concanavalin A-like superfamily)